MKKLLLLTTLLIAFAITLNAQTVLVDENFNGNTIPNNWTTYNAGDPACSSEVWTFGSGNVPDDVGDGSYDFATNAAIFDDDTNGPSGDHTAGYLVYGIVVGTGVDLSGYSGLITLSYDYSLYLEDNETLSLVVWNSNTGNYDKVKIYNADHPVGPEIINFRNIIDNMGTDDTDVTFGFLYEDDNGSWGWGAGVDNVKLEAGFTPPANDDCSNATDISGDLASSNSYSAFVDARGATNNAGFISTLPDPWDSGMNDGVWYTFTANYYGSVTINVDPDNIFDPQIGVFTGDCSNLNCIATVDDGIAPGEPETLTFDVQNGEQYYINIGDWSETADHYESTFQLDINLTVGVGEESIDGLKLFPNPVKDMLQINAPESIDEINVYNMTGQLVYHDNPIDKNLQINTAAWADGTYIVKVSANKQTGVYHIVKK